MRTRILGAIAMGALALSLAIAGCGDDPPSDDPDAAVQWDAQVDAQVGDDAAPDGGTPPSCEDILTTDVTFELDPDGPDTQFQAAVAFDGEGVWAVYGVPGANNYYDIRAVRIACDGAILWGPERVNTTDNNENEPVVAVNDGVVMIAWQADNNTGINNMDILVRTYEADGTPIMAEDRIVETTKNGQPQVGNAWMAELAALPNGQFALAGSRGTDDATAWQAFVQRLHPDGTAVDEALTVMYEPAEGQMYPSVAATPDGTIYVAFQRWPSEGNDQVYHTRFAPGALLPDPDPAVVALAADTGLSPSYAAEPGGGNVYLAFSDGTQVLLTDGAVFGNGPQVTLNAGSGPDYLPLVVATDGGGAVFWYRNISGYDNAFHAAPFTYDGASFTLGTTIDVTPAYVPPYVPAATHVMGNVYFAAWSDGSNPEFRIMGRFVSLE